MTKYSLRLLYIILTFAVVVPSFAEPTPNRLIIIGTKHNGNKEISKNSLYSLLNQIKPDIILLELDSTVVFNCRINKVWGAKTAEFLGIWNNPIEYRAARSYSEKHKDVCLAPFDIYIPNRRSYIEYQSNMERSHTLKLSQVNSDAKLSYNDSIAYAKYISINNAFVNIFEQQDLQRINRSSLMDTARLIMQTENREIRHITNTYKELESYRTWFNYSNDFWDYRNRGMCERIQRALIANSDRTIVILTGLLHKYYLTDYFSSPQMAKLCSVIPLERALEE